MHLFPDGRAIAGKRSKNLKNYRCEQTERQDKEPDLSRG